MDSFNSPLHQTKKEENKIPISPILKGTNNNDQISSSPTENSSEPTSGNFRSQLKNKMIADTGVNEGATLTETEYFYLAAAAIKIDFMLRFPQRSKEIMSMDVKKLFAQAQKEHTVFHEWHPWIIVQFGNWMLAEKLATVEEIRQATRSRWDPNEKFGSQDDQWSEMEKQSLLQPVQSLSPFPQENLKMHQEFKKTPETEFVIDYFKVTCDTVKGELFVTEEAIYFYAIKPGSKPVQSVKLQLDFNDITSIRKASTLVSFLKGPTVVNIKHKRQNSQKETVYAFSDFANLEESLAMMSNMWRAFLEKKKEAEREMSLTTPPQQKKKKPDSPQTNQTTPTQNQDAQKKKQQDIELQPTK